jgi:hypothetical protein
MNESPLPESLPIAFAQMVNLAVEYWRLARWLQAAGSAASAGPARHSVRKLEDFLKKHEFDVQHLDGRSFDPGLAARVIDTVEDASISPGKIIVIETLSPMVLWRGQVVRPAEVVTAHNGARNSST